MLTIKKIVFLFTLSICILFNSIGQGCSDAGFCTLNGMKPKSMDSIDFNKNNSIAIGISSGKADHSISILSTYLEYHHQFSRKLSLDTKLTGINQSGNGVSSTGFSDIYLNANYLFAKHFNAIVGFKIPLGSANKSGEEHLPLPMDYQSSLGTFDLILGFDYEIKKINFTLGLQQPLTQNNNQFLVENYPVNSTYSSFQSTNNYKRSADVLFRLSYPFNITKHFTVSPSILSIYHLSEDSFKDLNGIEQPISGSEGLTLNGTLYLNYVLSESHSINLNMGTPFITRKARPDGLTRKYVITLEYKYSF